MVVLIMGVAGAGKTTIGREVADRLGGEFVDGDTLHLDESIRKMSAGVPLVDADRVPWVRRIRERIDAALDEGRVLVITCSALREQHRQVMMDGAPDVRLVYLKGDFDVIEARLAARTDHFFGRALLESQFEALEEPDGAIEIDISGDVPSVVEATLSRLREPS